MALIRKRELAKMDAKERASKITELTFELSKAHVTAHKATAKTKEIKRTLARLHTHSHSTKQEALQPKK